MMGGVLSDKEASKGGKEKVRVVMTDTMAGYCIG